MMTNLQKAGYALRVLLGLTFIFSAIAKLASLDHFEIYIYSFGFLPLNVAFMLARVCICGEMMLGIGLASNLYGRLVNVATIVVVTLFCLFLCYALLIGRNDNCQCFGTLLNLDPAHSLLKNAALIVWTLVVSKVPSFRWRPKWYLWAMLTVLCLSIPFLIRPPDFWTFKDSRREIPYNKAYLEERMITDPLLIQCGLGNGRKVVAFVTPTCPYCKMSIGKIHTILQRNHLPDSSIVYVIPQPRTPIDTELGYSPIVVDRDVFTRITYGRRPILVFVENGVSLTSRHSRSINEAEWKNFFRGEPIE